MNKRIIQKQHTHQLILQNTRLLIEENGFMKVSAKLISQNASVAQGSIFLHFQTKNKLFYQIARDALISIQEKVTMIKNEANGLEDYIRKFLDIFSHKENILARIYQNLSELDDDIMTEVTQFEIVIKDSLFEIVQSHNPSNSIVNSFVAIDAFYAQLKEYLMTKNTFTKKNSVFSKKTGRILKLSHLLFKKGNS